MALPPTKYVLLVPLIISIQITFFIKKSVGHTSYKRINKQAIFMLVFFITQSGIEGFLY
jgi:hypothetical protein